MTTLNLQIEPHTITLFVYDEMAVSESVEVWFYVGLIRTDLGECGVTLEEYKRALGPLALKFSEEEIQRLFTISDRLASAIFNRWIDSRKLG